MKKNYSIQSQQIILAIMELIDRIVVAFFSLALVIASAVLFNTIVHYLCELCDIDFPETGDRQKACNKIHSKRQLKTTDEARCIAQSAEVTAALAAMAACNFWTCTFCTYNNSTINDPFLCELCRGIRNKRSSLNTSLQEEKSIDTLFEAKEGKVTSSGSIIKIEQPSNSTACRDLWTLLLIIASCSFCDVVTLSTGITNKNYLKYLGLLRGGLFALVGLYLHHRFFNFIHNLKYELPDISAFRRGAMVMKNKLYNVVVFMQNWLIRTWVEERSVIRWKKSIRSAVAASTSYLGREIFNVMTTLCDLEINRKKSFISQIRDVFLILYRLYTIYFILQNAYWCMIALVTLFVSCSICFGFSNMNLGTQLEKHGVESSLLQRNYWSEAQTSVESLIPSRNFVNMPFDSCKAEKENENEKNHAIQQLIVYDSETESIPDYISGFEPSYNSIATDVPICEQPANTTVVELCISNADARFFDEEQFRIVFGRCGNILKSKGIIIESETTETLKARIKFATKEQAEMAISLNNGKRFDRFKLNVSLTQP